MDILIGLGIIATAIACIFLYKRIRQHLAKRSAFEHQHRFYAFLYLIKEKWVCVEDYKKKMDIDMITEIFHLADDKNWHAKTEDVRYDFFMNEYGRVRQAIESAVFYYSIGITMKNQSVQSPDLMERTKRNVDTILKLDIRVDHKERLLSEFLSHNLKAIEDAMLRFTYFYTYMERLEAMNILNFLIAKSSAVGTTEALVFLKEKMVKDDEARRAA